MTIKQRLKRIGFRRDYFCSLSTRMRDGKYVEHAVIVDRRSWFAKPGPVLMDIIDTYGESEGVTGVTIHRFNRI